MVPYLVSNEDNVSLRKVPNEENMKAMMFDMDPLSVARPDSYIGHFFPKLLGSMLSRPSRIIFCFGRMHLGLNSNFFILIPRDDHRVYVEQYIPIALGSFMFKISLRIITTLLGGIFALVFSFQISLFSYLYTTLVIACQRPLSASIF